MMPRGAGANVYGGTRESGNWADLVNQSAGGSQNSSHTPRPGRASGVAGPGGRSLMAAPQGMASQDGMEYAQQPQQQLSASLPPEGLMGDGQADGEQRYGTGDVMGGSGRHATAGGNRTSSPMPQASVLLRPQNVRGLSPSPMRSLAVEVQGGAFQRSGSPMQQHSSTAAPGTGATRGISGQTASLDGVAQGAPGGPQFWQSPRPASPSASVFRQAVPQEAYSRGRSNTRALSPSAQPGVSPYAGMRTMSPSGALPARAGIAWSPVPPSPPAPKRSISPQPTSILVAGNNNSVSSLRWEPSRLR